jgi:hypothetical protein
MTMGMSGIEPINAPMVRRIVACIQNAITAKRIAVATVSRIRTADENGSRFIFNLLFLLPQDYSTRINDPHARKVPQILLAKIGCHSVWISRQSAYEMPSGGSSG